MVLAGWPTAGRPNDGWLPFIAGQFINLLGHPVCGLSYEGHCIENLIQAAGSLRVPCFYRTQVGAEIDLVLEKGAG